MTGALAVLRQALQRLVDEGNVVLVDVQSQQAEASGGASADAVQELQGLTDQVVVVLFVLITKEVLAEHRNYVGILIKVRKLEWEIRTNNYFD